MKLIIINPTSDDRVYVGGLVSIPAYGELEVNAKYWYSLLGDIDLRNDLKLNNVLINDGINELKNPVSLEFLETINSPTYSNKDSDGSALSRVKVTTTGWHFQVSPIGISTSTWNGFHHNYIDPMTLEETPTGFVTMKLYDANRQEITEEVNANLACYTVIDWMVDHEMEILGAIFTQAAPPDTDIYMYTVGAPGIANVIFGVGGVNLKCIGIGGIVDADGKAAKYMHPTSPVPGINKFRTIFVHGPGVVHKCQIIYKLFRPM